MVLAFTLAGFRCADLTAIFRDAFAAFERPCTLHGSRRSWVFVLRGTFECITPLCIAGGADDTQTWRSSCRYREMLPVTSIRACSLVHRSPDLEKHACRQIAT